MQSLLPAALAGYLLGSIPFGLIAGRLNGIDIRKHGSGNIGATNVLRILGKKWGYSVFALDVLKSIAAVLLVALFAPESDNATLLKIVAALAAILGHNFPVWLKFKGGKGVATTAGALIALLPIAALAASAGWVITFLTTRYVSLASIVAAIIIPLTVWIVERQVNTLFLFSLIVAILGIWRHRANIHRLLNGTESRFTKKKP